MDLARHAGTGGAQLPTTARVLRDLGQRVQVNLTTSLRREPECRSQEGVTTNGLAKESAVDMRSFGVAEWYEFLHAYSSTFLDDSSWLRMIGKEHVAPHVGREGWLGYAPASAQAIVDAEERLGVRLPST